MAMAEGVEAATENAILYLPGDWETRDPASSPLTTIASSVPAPSWAIAVLLSDSATSVALGRLPFEKSSWVEPREPPPRWPSRFAGELTDEPDRTTTALAP